MNSCRFCKHKLDTVFVDLGLSPISNAYLNSPTDKEHFYPLKTYVCNKCFLVQLEDHAKSEDHFNDNYAYFSSYSTSWLDHCRKYVNGVTKKLSLSSSSQVIEIASNDGYLLQYFDKNISVLGIEPSKSVAEAAKAKGINTIINFFTQKLAKTLPKADLILGNNVFAHVPDINDFTAGIKAALKPTGTVTLEFPHLLNLIEQNQFDTIYHEHYSYLSLITTQKIFSKQGLKIYNIEQLPTHGGSLRIWGCHEQDNKQISTQVNHVLSQEKKFGLEKIETYTSYNTKVVDTKHKLRQLLNDIKSKGNKIVAYGAAAKGNTLLNYCEVGKNIIDYVIDKSPHKQGKFLPGTHIPIVAPVELDKNKPDYILILPWNLKEEIVEQLKYLGAKFIVPIPIPQIL